MGVGGECSHVQGVGHVQGARRSSPHARPVQVRSGPAMSVLSAGPRPFHSPGCSSGTRGGHLACSLPGGDGSWRGGLVALPWGEPQPGTAGPWRREGAPLGPEHEAPSAAGAPRCKRRPGAFWEKQAGRQGSSPSSLLPPGPRGSPPAGEGGGGVQSNSSDILGSSLLSLVLEQKPGRGPWGTVHSHRPLLAISAQRFTRGSELPEPKGGGTARLVKGLRGGPGLQG